MAVRHGGRARRLLTDTALLAGSQVIVRLASVVAFLALTRSIEPNTYGLYQLALLVANSWAVLTNFSLRVPLVQSLAREPERAGELVGQVLALRLSFSILSLLGGAAWGLWTFHTARERILFGLLLWAAVQSTVAATFDDTLQGREWFKASAWCGLLQGLTVSFGTLLGVAVGRPLAFAVGSQVVASVLFAVSTWLIARRATGEPLRRLIWSRALASAMCKLAVGVAVAGWIGAWYGCVDMLAVQRMVRLGWAPAALGHYSVASNGFGLAVTAVLAVQAALTPMLARAVAAGEEALRPRLETVLRFGLLAFAPLAVLVSGLAPLLIALLKPEYGAAAGPLAVLIWLAPVVFCSACVHWVLYMSGRVWPVALCMAAGLATNWIGCRLFVPHGGLAAAGACRLAAELVILLLSARLMARVVRLDWRGVLRKPLLMAAAMGAIWWLTPGSRPLVALLSVAVYAVAWRVAGPLDARESELLRSMRRHEDDETALAS